MEASQMLRYLGQLGQLFNYSTRWNKFNPNDSQIRQRPLYKNETRIKSNQWLSSKRSKKYLSNNTKLLFIYPRTLEFSKIRGSDSDFRLEKKKERNQYVIRANNFDSDRSNRSLVYTRGTRSREKSRYLSSGRRKQGRAQSCALSPDSPDAGAT